MHMEVLLKRSTAALIAFIVIVFGTLFGVHRSVGSETAKIEKQFFSGVYLKDEEYLQPSIQSQLDKRATAALGLISLGFELEAAAGPAGELRDARNELLSAKTISDKYIANEKLQKAYKALVAAMPEGGPAGKTEALRSYTATMDGAQGVIEKSAYNGLVSEFRRRLNSFPVNILKILAFVKYPEYFGAEG